MMTDIKIITQDTISLCFFLIFHGSKMARGINKAAFPAIDNKGRKLYRPL
jgi:hypothetical protein